MKQRIKFGQFYKKKGLLSDMEQYKLLNGVTLAYIGDSYYELTIRKYLLDKGLTKVDTLHKNATKYVSAVSQAKILKAIVNNFALTEEEHDIIKRGRNAKNHTKANVNTLTYRHATAFETLIGYLYLNQQKERLQEIIDFAINVVESE